MFSCLIVKKKALFVTYFTLLQHFSVRQQHYTISKVEKAEKHNRTPLNKTIYNMIIFTVFLVKNKNKMCFLSIKAVDQIYHFS